MNELSEKVTFELLIGKVIKQILLSEDKQHLSFITSCGERYNYNVYADCCSESWIEKIENVSALIDSQVNAVEMKDDVKDENGEDPWRHGKPCEDGPQECTVAYFWTITTNRGYCDIEVRNSSNGYYSGSIYFDSKGEGDFGDLEFKELK